MAIDIDLSTCIIDGTKDSILGFLSNFGDFDFDGTNGDEYLWECAKGFDCNKSYVLDQVEKAYDTEYLAGNKGIEELIRLFFDLWTSNDFSYEVKLNVIAMGNNKFVVSVVVVYKDN